MSESMKIKLWDLLDQMADIMDRRDRRVFGWAADVVEPPAGGSGL